MGDRMTATTEPPPRIATLDIVRGVAVMGILAMNIIAFAMPPAAYVNPLAYGIEGDADLASWAFSFVLIDGKMRGLFSFLFGASMLLVIQKAAAKGENPASIHFSRMLWLLLFGCLHFILIWYGDILTGYATIGMIAWLCRDQEPRKLILLGGFFISLQAALFASMAFGYFYVGHQVVQPGADPELVKQWAEMQKDLGVPTASELASQMRLYGGSWAGLVHHQLTEKLYEPLIMILVYGCETLAYMLFGMAALRNGFLTGDWADSRYRRIALIGFAIAIPAYSLLAWLLWADGFTVPMLVALSMAATVPLRPVMIVAVAALIILLTRSGGALVERIAAAGRAAFTNYLGTSILMTGLFYGWGLGWFGTMSRIELWPVVLAMWVLMLTWSKPWLDRFQYGPFEWLWRSLSRRSLQPMRRLLAPAGAEAVG